MPPVVRPLTRNRVPKRRKVAGKIVPFAPDRAAELLSLRSFDQVIESLGFWAKQLCRVACPQCGIVGVLIIQHLAHGITVQCNRQIECHFAREYNFFGVADQ